MAQAAFTGSCHCGAIGYVYRTARAPEHWLVRACQCRFCRTHGVVSTSDPAGTVELSAREGALHVYRFGQRTADFWICRECGVYVAAVMEAGGRRYAVINVQTLETRPPSLPAPVEASFDAESVPQRTERRLQRWTPVVERSERR
ncbi:MAG TPA: GFA family protein [Gammaproteobacteria bacterium]|nr:GFA family protein [Gammaproteobacteria bacterium]